MGLDDLLIHDKTRQNINLFIENPFHALLISGDNGMGKTTLSQTIAAELLGVPSSRLDDYPYLIAIKKRVGKSEIIVDDIKNMLFHLKLKTTGTRKVRRAVIIDQAELMNQESQNMLLKVLEEPPEDTVFLLTSSKTQSLLPTITSRVQQLAVLPVSKEASYIYFGSLSKKSTISSAWELSYGAPSLMSAILNPETDHDLIRAVGQAKSILSSSSYERLLAVESFSKNKDQTILLVEALQKVIAALHRRSISISDIKSVKKFEKIRSKVLKTRIMLDLNTNVKLCMVDLILAL